mmetsp:Transcript_34598/g.87513  ORF Transcript_34598/g.87513 Transcript_34598/m.87513 type:complete len:484 (-) Transcript_34598:388-1839(-)
MMNIEPAPKLESRGLNDLLQAPSSSGQELAVDRTLLPYVNKDDPYRILQRSYERQYAQLYFARLMVMSKAVKQQVAARWAGLPMVKILEVGAQEEGLEVCVVGTLYKDMKLKPSILDEYTKDRGLSAALGATSFCSDDDSLVLEDEGARMALRADPSVLPVQQLLTGVVVAVRGVHEPGGDFLVREVLYAGMPAQPPRPVLEADAYVALLSGLRLSSKTQGGYLQLQLALDMLAGNLGGEGDQALAAKVVRVIVAGNSVGSLDTIAATNAYTRQQSYALAPVKDLDLAMSELAASVPVDVMPGSEDPTNVAMPQQPLHKCLFPGAMQYGSFTRATNPHAFELGGVHFLGTSGQPLEDGAKYSRGGDRLDLMQRCLEWRHVAPTAPDTLSAYPYHDTDPFILGATPHVFFAGNQPEFGTRVAKGDNGQEVRLVSIPSFSSTGTIVLLNLSTLACHPITFGAPAAAGTKGGAAGGEARDVDMADQ